MILLFGDVHGNLCHILKTVQDKKPAAIILLGDIESPQPLEKSLAAVMKLTEIYWIIGNHDTDSQLSYDNLMNSKLADRNLHGKVTEIDGVKVAGLGGIFREQSWYPKFSADEAPKFDNYSDYMAAEIEAEHWKDFNRDKKTAGAQSPELISKALTHQSTIFYEDWLNLSDQKAEILVTHDAPSCHPYGFVAIDALAQSMGVKRSFHGHMHDRLDYSEHEERLGFIPHGVGFCGVTDMNGGLISAGDFDYHFEKIHAEHKKAAAFTQ